MNGRIGNGLGDYAEARDNVIPSEALQTDWETPATINDTWGFKSDDENWKPPTVLIRKLVDIASKGGNYLLNVGPTAEGVIPQPSIDRRTTARGDLTYLHVFDWPPGGVVKVPSLGRPVRSAHLIRDGSAIPVRIRGDTVVVDGPADAPRLLEVASLFVKLGLIAFGGPAARPPRFRWWRRASMAGSSVSASNRVADRSGGSAQRVAVAPVRRWKVSVLGPGADHGRPTTGRRGGGGIQ